MGIPPLDETALSFEIVVTREEIRGKHRGDGIWDAPAKAGR